MAQQLPAVDALETLIGIREMLADVAQRGRAEQGIADRVQQHIGVGMAKQTAIVGNIDTADDQPAPLGEGMHVETVAYTNVHAASFKFKFMLRCGMPASRYSGPSAMKPWLA